jgi:hypothetical protein
VKNRPVHHTRRPPTRRYRRCHCPRRQSPIVDTFHAPLARWGFTLLALIALAASLGWPFLATAGIAALAWRHR